MSVHAAKAFEAGAALESTFNVDEALGCALSDPHPDARLEALRIAKLASDPSLLGQVATYMLDDRCEDVADAALSSACSGGAGSIARLARLAGVRTALGAVGKVPTTVAEAHRLDALTEVLVATGESSHDPTQVRPPLPPEQHTGEVSIPAGSLPLWLPGGADPAWFAVDERPGVMVEVDAFAIDTDAVTHARYDEFLRWIDEHGHTYCHHDEPPAKSHLPEVAFGVRPPEHPVVGVDWYDAYAFAGWSGKSLPSEDQWEYAARGAEGLRYPWGSSHEPDRCRNACTTFGVELTDGGAWRALLRTVHASERRVTTAPVGAYERSVSPFGARQMSGNVWEWTETRFVDRERFDPRLGTLERHETLGLWNAFVTVKGGSWSSAGDMLSPRYRAGQHLLTRSAEIGFRCVRDATSRHLARRIAAARW